MTDERYDPHSSNNASAWDEALNRGYSHDPNDWLDVEAQGDETLLELMQAKEQAGHELAEKELETETARLRFERLNAEITRRFAELGIDPEDVVQSINPEDTVFRPNSNPEDMQ